MCRMIASVPNDNVRVRTLLKLHLTRENDAGNEENEAHGPRTVPSLIASNE